MHPKLKLNPWAIACLCAVCFVFVAADSVGPHVPSVFTRLVSTNKTADAWRDALSAPSAAHLTAVSNAQVTTADNLVTVSNAQVATDGKLSGYVTNLGGVATNAALVGGTVTSQTNLDLTASRVMVSSADNVPESSTVTTATLAFLDATSSVQTQLDSKPTVALTNVARLDQDQTWTGTPTFPAAAFTANSIGIRRLWSSPANIFVESAPAVSNPFNSGDYALVTPVASFQIPPLLGSNSSISIFCLSNRTNANANTASMAMWIGPNTNFVGTLSTTISASTGTAFVLNFNPILFNAGSMTNQLSVSLGNSHLVITNFFDASITNTVYLGMYGNTFTRTNDLFVGLAAFEMVRP